MIVGAGKTAMDACLWLLRHGIAPQRLTWIEPREAPSLLNRAGIQPPRPSAKKVLADVSAQLEVGHKKLAIGRGPLRPARQTRNVCCEWGS